MPDNSLNSYLLRGLEEFPLNKGGEGIVFNRHLSCIKKSLPKAAYLISLKKGDSGGPGNFAIPFIPLK
jgi:hypothetical protein